MSTFADVSSTSVIVGGSRVTALVVGLSLTAFACVRAVGRIELQRRRLQREKLDLIRWEGEGGAAHPDEPAIDDHPLGVA